MRKTYNICLTVATALTVYGIETSRSPYRGRRGEKVVATALTVYGIETMLLR